MKTAKPLIAFLLVTLTLPCFATLHYVSQTLKPTAKVAYAGAKAGSFPVRHPKRTARGFAQAVKTVF